MYINRVWIVIVIILIVAIFTVICVNFLIGILDKYHELNYRLDSLDYEVSELDKKIDIFYRILNEKISKK